MCSVWIESNAEKTEGEKDAYPLHTAYIYQPNIHVLCITIYEYNMCWRAFISSLFYARLTFSSRTLFSFKNFRLAGAFLLFSHTLYLISVVRGAGWWRARAHASMWCLFVVMFGHTNNRRLWNSIHSLRIVNSIHHIRISTSHHPHTYRAGDAFLFIFSIVCCCFRILSTYINFSNAHISYHLLATHIQCTVYSKHMPTK